MTRRSMPSSFHANLFALVPARCPSSTRDVAIGDVLKRLVVGDTLRTTALPSLPKVAAGDVPFLPAFGDTPCASAVSNARESATRFWPNSGLRFPDGVGCGKCDPENRSETGCRFPNRPQTESASHSGAPKRDALSAQKNCRSRVKRQLRYSPRINVASSAWVSTT